MNYDSVNIESLEGMSYECGFDNMYLTGCVNEQVMILNGGLQILHSTVPLKRRMIRECWDSWINAPKIQYCLSLRDLAYDTYWDSRTYANWKIFRRCRNKAKSSIRKQKRKAHISRFENNDGKQIWSILKENGVVDGVDNLDNVDPDYLNNVFSSNQTMSNDIIDTTVYPHNGFFFRSVDLYEVFSAFDLIKTRTIGYDGFDL